MLILYFKLHPTLQKEATETTFAPADVNSTTQAVAVEIFFKGDQARLDELKSMFVDGKAIVRPFNVRFSAGADTSDQFIVIGNLLTLPDR